MKKVLLGIIRFYQKLPLPCHSCCRYYPTCSQYAIESIEEYGVFKGSYFAIKRILRCNPFHQGGYDPVVKER